MKPTIFGSGAIFKPGINKNLEFKDGLDGYEVKTATPENSWWHRRDELEAYAKSLDPVARVSRKTSFVWGIGALRTFATTIGRTVYFPDNWTFEQAKSCMPHEVLGHVAQFRWAGFFIHPTVGIPLGLFLYALMPLPIFGAWVRYRAELHAETKAWEYKLPRGLINGLQLKARAVRFAKMVGGKQYVYSMPHCWVLRGFTRRAEKVINAVKRRASGQVN